MKTEQTKTLDGKDVTILIPENEADLEELDQRLLKGEIDPTDYFHGEDQEV